MRPRMGFALVRYLAPRRRQDPWSQRIELAWIGVPPIAGFAAPAHLLNAISQNEGRRSARLARVGFAVLTVRLVRTGDRTPERIARVEHHRSIRPRSCEWVPP